MTEFKVSPDNDGFALSGLSGPSGYGYDIGTLAYMLLFTWRRAEEGDELPDGMTGRQGFWADKDLGCKWWLRVRLICNEESLQIIKRDAEQALQILKDKGLVSKIEYQTNRVSETVGGIKIQLFEPDGKRSNVIIDDVWGEIRKNVH